MAFKSMGFIGGGWVTRIVLMGLRRKKTLPSTVVVSDIDGEVLKGIKASFPRIQVAVNDNTKPAAQDIVFLALHPPALPDCLKKIGPFLRVETVVVSLAPCFSISALIAGLGGFNRIVRMIPNAPSMVGEGYNPTVFGPGISQEERYVLGRLFKKLGDCPVVDEGKLEAYAVVTAMGPTYLWFQLFELLELGRSFGLTEKQAWKGIKKTLKGAVATVDKAGLPPAELLDLIPVKPLKEEEDMIKTAYRTRLPEIYRQLKGVGNT